MNSRFGSGSGEATFKIEGGKLIVEVETSGLKEVAHIQTVRKGACPGETADTNDDDIVDASELGQEPALLVLENNPTSDVTGNYFYSSTIDQTVLGDEELSDKIVVIHGIAAEESLPDTVKGLGQDDQHETMPVLCGSLMKDDSSEDGQQDQQPPHQQQQQQTQDMISVPMPESSETSELE